MRPRFSCRPEVVAHWAAALGLVSLAAVPALDLQAFREAMSPLVARMHPLLVHFPIGLLVVAGVLDLAAAMFGRETRSPAVKACLLLGLLGALVAAGSGWIYAELEPPGRSLEETLFYHRWLGISAASTAALSWLLYLMSRDGERSGPRRLSRVVLFACLVLVSIGGHLGGEMVHGEAFLAEPLQGVMDYLGGSGDDAAEGLNEGGPALGDLALPVEGAITESGDSAESGVGDGADAGAVPVDEGTELFVNEVFPIFETRCHDCHGPTKQKADLRLDFAAGGLYGGEGLLVPGSPESSELVRRISLPADDFDIMPAKGDPLSSAQIEAIRRWVTVGAPWPEG